MPESPRETRVYTFTGRVAHLLSVGDGANSHARALCGFSPAWHYFWHGTGSQAEYEAAAALRTCKYCAKRLEEDSQPWPELLGPQGAEK